MLQVRYLVRQPRCRGSRNPLFSAFSAFSRSCAARNGSQQPSDSSTDGWFLELFFSHIPCKIVAATRHGMWLGNGAERRRRLSFGSSVQPSERPQPIREGKIEQHKNTNTRVSGPARRSGGISSRHVRRSPSQQHLGIKQKEEGREKKKRKFLGVSSESDVWAREASLVLLHEGKQPWDRFR